MASGKAEKKTAKKKISKRAVKRPVAAAVDEKKLQEEIRVLIADVLEVKTSEVKPGLTFESGMGMDSMRALEMLAAIEKKYKIEIPEQELMKMASLKDIVRVTKKQLEKKARGGRKRS